MFIFAVLFFIASLIVLLNYEFNSAMGHIEDFRRMRVMVITMAWLIIAVVSWYGNAMLDSIESLQNTLILIFNGKYGGG